MGVAIVSFIFPLLCGKVYYMNKFRYIILPNQIYIIPSASGDSNANLEISGMEILNLLKDYYKNY
jgi:hypothetical protein